MVRSFSRALLRSSSLIILISTSVSVSSAAFASGPLEVVVTAERSEVPLKNTGSAITVITSEEIEKYGSKNISDVLRTVPGLTIAETGGLGGEAKVSLRGASPGASMILLDGVRISDPSNTEGYFDFGNFSAANVERIEILRGPQSALYGSDAMGGVVNIITKKGKRTPVREVTVEGGSYGTYGARGSMSGATENVSYSFGVNALHSEGFARYGYRVDRPLYFYYLDHPGGNNISYPIGSGTPTFFHAAFPAVPKSDPVDKSGLNANVAYRINDNVTVETGFSYSSNALQFDNPDANLAEYIYNPNNRSRAEILTGFVRTKFDLLDGQLHNQFIAFGNETNRNSWQMDYYLGPTGTGEPWRLGYHGKRIGAEYQGDLKTGTIGTFTFGGRREAEYAETDQSPYPDPASMDEVQTTNSVFAQQRLTLTDRLDMSFGGRIDTIESGPTFPTWRSTAAYRVDETATKLRASVGTGAKAPSLFQRLSFYGNPDLQAEKSFGYDFGVDQALYDGRMNFSATYFNADYTNKIDYNSSTWKYENIARVSSQGVELAIDYLLVPTAWSTKFSYTFTDGIDRDKGQQLYRVPRHQAYLSILYSGLPKWEFEPRLTWVGSRLDLRFYSDGYLYYDYNPDDPLGTPTLRNFYLNSKSEKVTLPGYAKFDFLTRYSFNASNDAYIRFENLTDAHTEDVYNYGSAGRSVYVGWTTRW